MYSSALLLFFINCREHQGVPGMSPGLSQSAPAGWSSPSCQHPSLLSPHSGWIQQGGRGLERGPWGSVLKDRNKVLQVLLAASAPLGSHGDRHRAGTALTQPGPCGLSLPSILQAPTSALSAAGA